MHRSMTRPFLAKDRIRDFETLDKHAMKATGKIKRRVNEGYAANLEVGCTRDPSANDLADKRRPGM